MNGLFGKYPEIARALLAFSLLLPTALSIADEPASRAIPIPQPRLARDNLLLYRGEKNEALVVRSTDDWLKRRAEILQGMQAVMGQLPGNEKRCPLAMKIEAEVDCGTFVRLSRALGRDPV